MGPLQLFKRLEKGLPVHYPAQMLLGPDGPSIFQDLDLIRRELSTPQQRYIFSGFSEYEKFPLAAMHKWRRHPDRPWIGEHRFASEDPYVAGLYTEPRAGLVIASAISPEFRRKVGRLRPRPLRAELLDLRGRAVLGGGKRNAPGLQSGKDPNEWLEHALYDSIEWDNRIRRAKSEDWWGHDLETFLNYEGPNYKQFGRRAPVYRFDNVREFRYNPKDLSEVEDVIDPHQYLLMVPRTWPALKP